MYNKTRICECCGKELVYGSYSAWYLAEKNHSICKSCAAKKRVKKLSDLSVLLEDTPETYYWIGFLLADGHFDEKRIVVGLSEHDRDHLEKFAKYIDYSGKIVEIKRPPYDDAVRLSSMDTVVVEKLREKFDIKNNKTYNPPKTLNWIPDELFLYLLVGIIDGDGSINESCIRIKVHIAWIDIFKEFCKRLDLPDKNVFVTKENYCVFYINRCDTNRIFKDIIINNSVPFLFRKWSNIIIDGNGEFLRGEFNGPKKSKGTEKVIQLYKDGYSTKQISEIVNKKEGTVLKIKSRYINKPDLNRKEKCEEKKKQVKYLLGLGKTGKEVSEIVGVSSAYVTKIKKTII